MSTPSGSPFQTLLSAANDFAKLEFVFNQLLLGKATATIVRVEACTNSGGLVPQGTVDVTPLVNQVDGAGNSVAHQTIYGLPYHRIQGGSNAVIMDPAPGDLGIAVFASRDISGALAAKAPANPGSARVMDYADGMYIGGIQNGVPAQYILFAAAGVTVVSPGKVTVQANEIDLTATAKIALTAPEIDLAGVVNQTVGNLNVAQSAVVTGDVTAGGKSLHNHTHGPGTYVAGATPVTGSSATPT